MVYYLLIIKILYFKEIIFMLVCHCLLSTLYKFLFFNLFKFLQEIQSLVIVRKNFKEKYCFKIKYKKY